MPDSHADALATDRSVAGFYESVEVSNGGLGTVIHLSSDGEASSVTTVLLDGTYELDGTDVRWHVRGSKHDEVLRARIYSDSRGASELELVFRGGPDFAETQVRALRRVEIPEERADLLHGVWSWSRPNTGEHVYEQYRPDGTFAARIPLSPAANSGTWAWDGDSIVVRWGDRAAVVYEVAESSTGEIRLLRRSDSSATLRYVGPVLWYPLLR